jgi:uncharacterized protein YndB with AHSA1/START domain
MRKVLFAVAGVIALVLLLAGVAALVGSRLPPRHTATRSIVLNQQPQAVYAVARDFASMPSWRAEVTRIDVQPPTNGPVRFREESEHGIVNYELTEDVPGARMVTRILDTDLGYSGSWTYTFTPERGGTRVAITENGEVSNVLFRSMSRYVFGHTATVDAYLSALAKRFGETATPQ